jgi:hypothetical protein
MDVSGDDKIAQLLRLKRYERPPPGYFENFLDEFHRRQRQRDELFHQPLWRICFERAKGLALLLNIRSLAPAGLGVMVACAAVFSIRLYQETDTTQLAVQGSPVPSTPANAGKKLDLAPPALNSPFDMRPTLRSRTRGIPVLPADLPANSFRYDKFVPLDLEWESLQDQSLLGE